MTNQRFRPDKGDAIYRRSVYTFWKRAMPPPQMTILNAPIRDACIARRERTNTPSQALLLLNEPEYIKAARTLALQVLRQPQNQRITFAWETITARVPDEKERATIQLLLDELEAKYIAEPALADELCQGLAEELGQSTAAGSDATPLPSQATLAAWTVAINTLYNLDITKTQE
jgi:hypothetical protein